MQATSGVMGSPGRRGWVSVVLVAGVLTLGGGSALSEEIDFGRDIRPILSNNCFQCHGGDESSREADLRLDLREDALRDRGGMTVIVPGKPEASELIRRITAEDRSERMPPRSANKTLTAWQIELLTEWVRRGASYEEHWAFQPVRRPEVPSVKHADRVRNEIDAFVLKRLEREGLSPSPEADRATLVRRVYQDLIGLLPTPEEADAFINDPDPAAYERLVERRPR